MKKSKLLMPLTGIAAIGAIAPVAVMTACNKGEKEIKFVTDQFSGKIIDANTKSKTNKYGIETLKSGANWQNVGVDFVITLNHKYEATNTVTITIDAQGKAGAEGDAFYVPAWTGSLKGSDVTEVADKVVYAHVDEFLKPNKERLDVLAKETSTTKTQEFKFDAKYVETNSKGEVIGRQTVTYTVVACPHLHDCVVVNTACELDKGAEPRTTTPTTIELGDGGAATKYFLADADAAKQDITVKLNDDIVVKNTTDVQPVGAQVLTIAKDQEMTISEGECTTDAWIHGTISAAITTPASGTVKYLPEEATFFSFTFTVENNKNYVEDSWTCSFAIGKTTGIEVSLD